jgi:hypothetical protein
MKHRNVIVVLSWVLLAITGAAGFGVTHVFERAFDPLTHKIIEALGQLVPLAGILLLSLFLEEKSATKPSPPSEPTAPMSGLKGPVTTDRSLPSV